MLVLQASSTLLGLGFLYILVSFNTLLCSDYYMPGTLLGPLQIGTHLMLVTTV